MLPEARALALQGRPMRSQWLLTVVLSAVVTALGVCVAAVRATPTSSPPTVVSGSVSRVPAAPWAPVLPAARQQSAVSAPASPTMAAASERQLLDRYCVSCHNEKARAAGVDSSRKLALDSLDVAQVSRDAQSWELVVRKLRAGMMPPAGMPRPDPATYESMAAWLESELDRDTRPYTPPPGLHRLNRTEYANAVHDLLDLPIDPAKYLPSRRFDGRVRQHRGRARHLVDAGRGLRDGGAEDQPPRAWRAGAADAGDLPDARGHARRTITSKGCRSARVADCSSIICSPRTASTRSP